MAEVGGKAKRQRDDQPDFSFQRLIEWAIADSSKLLQDLRAIQESAMAAAYIEPRPKAREAHTKIGYYTIVSGGQDNGTFSTQEAAIKKACDDAYRPVYVARVRHNIDHGNPDHFREHHC